EYALSMNKKGGSLAISIDISDAVTGNPNLALQDFTGLYSGVFINQFPSSLLPCPAYKPNSTPLYLGATLVASSGLVAGSYTGYFAITIFVL
ncbi:MAG: hypothetical protein PHE27_08415, partial [Alphaproteobacteria bacterium]|nr:hypothetical protein [Alphaproteobacteria bacterium]